MYFYSKGCRPSSLHRLLFSVFLISHIAPGGEHATRIFFLFYIVARTVAGTAHTEAVIANIAAATVQVETVTVHTNPFESKAQPSKNSEDLFI